MALTRAAAPARGDESEGGDARNANDEYLGDYYEDEAALSDEGAEQEEYLGDYYEDEEALSGRRFGR